MTFALEALQAYDGDCLLLHYGQGKLILIDGGPGGTYQNVLRDRLNQLRGDSALNLHMAIVSHIDADHITGMVQLFRDLATAQEDGDQPDIKVRTLWHNSFEKLVGGTKACVESGVVGAAVGGTAVPAGLDYSVQAVVESVKQGNDLRRYARKVTTINSDFGGNLISAPESGRKVIKVGDGLTFTILGPHETELNDLEKKWRESKDTKPTPEAVAADYLNRTVPNLSSIVILAEMSAADGEQPRRMLLTGDAGGDLIQQGLEAAGLLENGSIHVDLLKVQHHGSRHSVEQEFFELVTADRYVISGNGKHGNPHKLTLQWLSAARRDQPYDVYLTNRTGDEGLTKALDEFLEEEESQPAHRYHFREDPELSITVDLFAAHALS